MPVPAMVVEAGFHVCLPLRKREYLYDNVNMRKSETKTWLIPEELHIVVKNHRDR